MTALSFAAVPLALAAVLAVLVMGFANLIVGGSPARSQRLMRWRVLLQAAALAVVMLTICAHRP